MPKLKTKSSAKKRFSFTAKGKVRFNSAGLSHMLRRRSQKMKRTNRGTQIMAESNARTVRKYYLPYK
jgi:large subunit ribosomal protein L35